ncbi:class I adenylate-forming enzyme family protein [Nocardioides sp.]|uniref:class I adenylate-forming enzyme family protein n=1 Tax=Nocardioides sp. TaxID=35761 RepID=UPI003783E5E1
MAGPTVGGDQVTHHAWREPGPIWSGTPLRSIADLVDERARQRPQAVVLHFEDGVQVTRAQLAESVREFADHLAGRIVPGDRVAVAVGNRAEFFVAWLGTLAAGGVVVQMNPSVGRHDAKHVLADSGARLVVADDAAVAVIGEVRAACPELEEVLVVDASRPEPCGLSGFRSGEGVRAALREWDADAPATIYYTSGTTGAPKGCVNSEAGILRYVDLMCRLYRPAADDRLFNPLQFFYGDAIWLFLTALRADTRMVSMRRFSVSRFWATVRDTEATILLGIGAIPSLLLTSPPTPDERDHSVRMALQIGVPVRRHAELVERFGFPWIELYGQAESGLTIGMPAHLADDYTGTGAIGIPMPEVEVRLVERGRVVGGPGQGEVQVRAPHIMREYLGRPDATAEAITDDGWLRTGDRVSRDEHGVHYFLGRIKEIIRRGGENIAPFEVESVLRMHPDVVDAAVVPVHDALRGEEVMAYVQLRPEARVSEADLVEFSAGLLAAYKVPRFVRLRSAEFPRTPSHRIRKSDLTVDGRHQSAGAWDRDAGASR